MTKIGDFSIDAEMVVSEETVQRCLLLLNRFLEDHQEMTLSKVTRWNDTTADCFCLTTKKNLGAADVEHDKIGD